MRIKLSVDEFKKLSREEMYNHLQEYDIALWKNVICLIVMGALFGLLQYYFGAIGGIPTFIIASVLIAIFNIKPKSYRIKKKIYYEVLRNDESSNIR